MFQKADANLHPTYYQKKYRRNYFEIIIRPPHQHNAFSLSVNANCKDNSFHAFNITHQFYIYFFFTFSFTHLIICKEPKHRCFTICFGCIRRKISSNHSEKFFSYLIKISFRINHLP